MEIVFFNATFEVDILLQSEINFLPEDVSGPEPEQSLGNLKMFSKSNSNWEQEEKMKKDSMQI